MKIHARERRAAFFAENNRESKTRSTLRTKESITPLPAWILLPPFCCPVLLTVPVLPSFSHSFSLTLASLFQGSTVAHLAAMGGKPDVIQVLSELVPNLWDVPNAQGRLPRDLCHPSLLAGPDPEMTALLQSLEGLTCGGEQKVRIL